jgi:hypothetical protein
MVHSLVGAGELHAGQQLNDRPTRIDFIRSDTELGTAKEENVNHGMQAGSEQSPADADDGAERTNAATSAGRAYATCRGDIGAFTHDGDRRATVWYTARSASGGVERRLAAASGIRWKLETCERAKVGKVTAIEVKVMELDCHQHDEKQ